MYAAELTLNNWSCFRGKQSLALRPNVYGIIAQRTNDPERSNWLGKTTLLNTIRFALYGKHSFRTEDEWITRDEFEGGVTLVTDTGLSIERSRARGRKTRLIVNAGTGGSDAKDDEAQSIILESVGLSYEDFVATCSIEQKRMNRFLVIGPTERMKVVVEWLRIEALQRCHKRIGGWLNSVLDSIAEKERRSETLAHEVKQILLNAFPNELEQLVTSGASIERGRVEKLFKDAIEAFRKAIETSEQAIIDAKAKRAAYDDWHRAKEKALEYDEVVAEGKALRKLVDKDDLPALVERVGTLRKRMTDLAGTKQEARTDANRKRALATGQFDGKCPVGDMKCPVADKLNGQRKENKKLLVIATEKETSSINAFEEAEELFNVANDELTEANERAGELARLRLRASGLKSFHDRIESEDEPEEPSDTQTTKGEASAALAYAEKAFKRYRDVSDEIALLASEIADLQQSVDLHREALVIVGREGAQKRIARSAILDIEKNANLLLEECGIDLRMTLRWSRPNERELADTCGSCGKPFGASRRIKICERCGEQRGPKIINSLEFILSQNSNGAAEDLAGGAFQLAASAWLWADRTCAWSTCLIDEPFGALDAANRRAFSNHLVTMLRGAYGFNQAFIVAHHMGVIDALPGRIEIINDGNSSTARVIVP